MLLNVTSLGNGHRKRKYSHIQPMLTGFVTWQRPIEKMLESEQPSKNFPNLCLVTFFFLTFKFMIELIAIAFNFQNSSWDNELEIECT